MPTISIGWVDGSVANVFVTNHDTERVSASRHNVNVILISCPPERQLPEQQLALEHLRICHGLLARTPLRHSDHPLQLQRFYEQRRRLTQRWGGHMLGHWRRQRLVLPAPLGRHRRHGRLQEQRRQRSTHELGVSARFPNRVRSRYVVNIVSNHIQSDCLPGVV